MSVYNNGNGEACGCLTSNFKKIRAKRLHNGNPKKYRWGRQCPICGSVRVLNQGIPTTYPSLKIALTDTIPPDD